MFEFKLPDLGEGIHEGELLQWYVAEGDTIKEDDPLCEVETDKAAVTIPSPRSGTIASLNGAPGDTIHVGDVFVVIDDGSGAGAAAPAKKGKEEGDGRQEKEKTDGPASGSAGKTQITAAESQDKTGSVKQERDDRAVIAAPATRRLAREMGIDIHEVTGTGPGGRITPEDLKTFEAEDTGGQDAGTREDAAKSTAVSGPAPKDVDVQGIPFLEVPWAPMEDGGLVEREPIRSLRRKVAVKTATSSILIPHVAHMDDIDVTEIDTLRKAYNDENPDQGNLTLMAFVIKAVTAGLQKYPMFNASIDLAANEIVHKKYYNIGFAADTPRGLMVPVIQDADRQSLSGLGFRIRHLARKARNGEIEVSDLTSGTFTVTNVGAIGGTHVFPIINAPETAILGLGRVAKKPVVMSAGEKDEIRIRAILPVTLCFDHRVADGAQAAAFVRDVKAMLESSLTFMTQV